MSLDHPLRAVLLVLAGLAVGWWVRGPHESAGASAGAAQASAATEAQAPAPDERDAAQLHGLEAKLRRIVRDSVRQELEGLTAPQPASDEGAVSAAKPPAAAEPKRTPEQELELENLHDLVTSALQRGEWKAEDARYLSSLSASVPEQQFREATLELIRAINSDRLQLATRTLLSE